MPSASAPDDRAPQRPLSRQQEAGAVARAETKRRLLAAAVAEFQQNGYTRTTVAAIAGRAGVTVQTLYLAWGSKLALLEAYLDQSLTAGRGSGVVGPTGREAMLAPLQAAGDDPVRLVFAIAALFRRICERTGLAWQLYQDAATAHAEVAEQWHRLQVQRRETFRQVVTRIPVAALRPGLSMDDAVDTAWAIASPDTYALFIRHHGSTLDEYEAWLRRTLLAALIAPGRAGADPAPVD